MTIQRLALSRVMLFAALCGATVLCFMILHGGAGAQSTGTGPLPPQTTSECAQECFDQFVENSQTCQDLNCNFWHCDDDALNMCLDNAQTVFQICLQGC